LKDYDNHQLILRYGFSYGVARQKYLDTSQTNGAFDVICEQKVDHMPGACGGSGSVYVTIKAIPGGADHGFLRVTESMGGFSMRNDDEGGFVCDSVKVNIERRPADYVEEVLPEGYININDQKLLREGITLRNYDDHYVCFELPFELGTKNPTTISLDSANNAFVASMRNKPRDRKVKGGTGTRIVTLKAKEGGSMAGTLFIEKGLNVVRTIRVNIKTQA